MNAEQLLHELLSGKSSALDQLRLELKTSKVVSAAMTIGDKKILFDIYSKRAALNKRTGGRTHGYEELLSQLQKPEWGAIVVLGINTETASFLVFSEEDSQNVLGILWG